MSINTLYLERLLQTLHASLEKLQASDSDSVDFEIYRNAVIKGFELTLELSGKLLRKALKSYGGSPNEIDSLVYKDVFRRGAKHGLLDISLVERWFIYRDNRNNTAHDYGVQFANDTLKLLPEFIKDATHIAERLRQHFTENGNA